MANPIRFVTARLRQWLFNRRPAPRYDVQLEAMIQPRLLVSIALSDAQRQVGEFIGLPRKGVLKSVRGFGRSSRVNR